jgi:hypothetical protein
MIIFYRRLKSWRLRPAVGGCEPHKDAKNFSH